jgi:hypothetical protein
MFNQENSMTSEESESPPFIIVRLFFELANIEACNQEYSHAESKEIDIVAYLVRQERREEILSLLGTSLGRA